MRNRWQQLISAVALMLFIGANQAQGGQTLTYSFTGSVSQIREQLGPDPRIPGYSIAVGTPLEGVLSYDPTTPDSDPDPGFGHYSGAATLSFRLGTLTYSSPAWITVGNNVSSLPLVSGVRGYDTPQGPFDGDWLIVRGDQFSPFGVVSLAFKGTPGYSGGSVDAWNSDALPNPLPNAILGGGILTNMFPSANIIDVDITTITPVPAPEPSTLTMAGIGLVVALGWTRQRRVKQTTTA